jgi:hypothetical protein
MSRRDVGTYYSEMKIALNRKRIDAFPVNHFFVSAFCHQLFRIGGSALRLTSTLHSQNYHGQDGRAT